MAAIISGFLLLSIYTLSTIKFIHSKTQDLLKLFTVTLFAIVAVCYIFNYIWGYWILVGAVFFQIIITLIELFNKKNDTT